MALNKGMVADQEEARSSSLCCSLCQRWNARHRRAQIDGDRTAGTTADHDGRFPQLTMVAEKRNFKPWYDDKFVEAELNDDLIFDWITEARE